MTDLFGRDKSVISRHLRNVFSSGELERGATVAKNATVQREGDREIVRAQLRVIVKRILRKYGYPPDKQEKATQDTSGMQA